MAQKQGWENGKLWLHPIDEPLRVTVTVPKTEGNMSDHGHIISEGGEIKNIWSNIYGHREAWGDTKVTGADKFTVDVQTGEVRAYRLVRRRRWRFWGKSVMERKRRET